jgi:hypothetical protein
LLITVLPPYHTANQEESDSKNAENEIGYGCAVIYYREPADDQENNASENKKHTCYSKVRFHIYLTKKIVPSQPE